MPLAALPVMLLTQALGHAAQALGHAAQALTNGPYVMQLKHLPMALMSCSSSTGSKTWSIEDKGTRKELWQEGLSADRDQVDVELSCEPTASWGHHKELRDEKPTISQFVFASYFHGNNDIKQE
eukprot:407557-Pelagomonas_calceolata.AAC.3